MRIRAAIILIQNATVTVIERRRENLHYFLFPGGGVEAGETPQEAAIREAYEELGVHVALGLLVAEVTFGSSLQYYFLAELQTGTFGTGAGEEYNRSLRARGTYRPVWLPLTDVPHHPVLPRAVAQLVVQASTDGWTTQPLQIEDRGDDRGV